jgi:hypothetical protein
LCLPFLVHNISRCYQFPQIFLFVCVPAVPTSPRVVEVP